MGNKKANLETDAVDDDIPLLLSKAAIMKKAQTVLDFKKDIDTMFGQERSLLRTSSGHHAIPKCPVRLEIENSESTIRNDYRYSLISVKTSSCRNKKKVIEKLHRQFCHCSADELKQLIKSSEIW